MFFKKFIIITALLSVAAAGSLLYLKFKPSGNGRIEPVKVPYSQAELEAQANSQKMAEELGVIAATDKDLDGILDADEVKYKTSPTSSDTDADGLLDKDEIFLYKTDPNNPDTDKDGFKDGYEARRGYNPNGPGKLKNF